MTIQQAVEKAIEGGYGNGYFKEVSSFDGHYVVFLTTDWGGETMTLSEFLLDKNAWQSLGKAMGWENESECPLACCGGICPIDIPMWQSQWHLFIDKLANGGTAEQFFNQKMSFSG